MTNLDYKKRLTNLKNRRQGNEISKSFEFDESTAPLKESYELTNDSDSMKYAIGSMEEVDKKYTQVSFENGERVKRQLEKLRHENFNISFEYQGSVTNNTHILSTSDIDLLLIHEGFYDLESPQIATNPFDGNPENELLKLRQKAIEHLSLKFPKAKIDTKGAKSISLEGGTLERKIDVVPSNWINTLKYSKTGLQYYRGIMILDCREMKRMANTPFYHNFLIEEKDKLTDYRFKKVVRLLKNLKADSDVLINLSSYDLTAVAYNMPTESYLIADTNYKLINSIKEYLINLSQNEMVRNELDVPDNSRKIFLKDSETELLKLIKELDNLLIDILKQQISR